MTRGVAIAALVATGCGGSDPAPAPAAAPALVASIDDRDVVATVDGRPILADCVLRQAKAGSLDVRDAVDECIAFELLAMEAERRGYAADEHVAEVRARESVRALIDRDFAGQWYSPASIPRDEIARVWKQPAIHSRYNHPEYRFCFYVRAKVPPDVPRGSPQDTAAEAIIRTAHAATRTRTGWTRNEWFAAVEAAVGDYPLEYQHKRYDTPRKGKSEENFARALFAIDQPRTVSEPVRTRWGWDLLLLTRIVPEARARLGEVEDELRAEMWAAPPVARCNRANCDTARQRAFKRWAKTIGDTRDVRIHDDGLDLLSRPPSP